MLRYIDHKKMGGGNLGWLSTIYHFSFADYFNPKNVQFGILRVVNDDEIDLQTGFDFHPHSDMEIITYVVRGALTHEDNLGNKSIVSRGEVQYMSAGTGIFHREFNDGNHPLRLLQIWVLPSQKGLSPNYGDHKFDWNLRLNHWLKIVSGDPTSSTPVKINADMNIYVAEIQPHTSLDFRVYPDRQAYMIQVEGSSKIEDCILEEKDALEITDQDVHIEPITTSHIILFEMKKENEEC